MPQTSRFPTESHAYIRGSNPLPMRTTLSLLLIAAVITVSAQKAGTEVPAAVKAAFEKAHPNAQHVKWSREDQDYEAEFDQDGQEMSVMVDAAGAIKETEVELKVNMLPNPIHEYVASKYPGKKIKEGCKITMADGAVKYEAEVGGEEGDLLFDSQGHFIGQENDEDKDGDEEDEKD